MVYLYYLSFIVVYSVKHADNKRLQTKAAWKRSVFVCLRLSTQQWICHMVITSLRMPNPA